ncbi:Glycoprotein-N-acetylgalactosamine 3-beta-galactosyltransferase 1 [Daphnia magna]|uniref:Glycoprotein-N-acetylgalactosamine 3-beta-galactosyltransferase 1 n=2 Tax=Daphnia TaxID=6668 RepID=A0A162D3U9_9CRUS|nr:Glycoprotein-N-acetylgalactosamine 3-beta-galactosyltransferase 1 [Daphnia magna]
MRSLSRSSVLTLAAGMTFGFCLAYIFISIRLSSHSPFSRLHKPRFPGDDGEDAHGHGHDHGDAHNEEDMESLAGPVRDFGLHGRHEDSHAG